jgi:hypothetical protein
MANAVHLPDRSHSTIIFRVDDVINLNVAILPMACVCGVVGGLAGALRRLRVPERAPMASIALPRLQVRCSPL